MKTISLEVSDEFDRRLRVTAAHMDLKRSEFIRQALAEKLAHLEGVATCESVKTTESPAVVVALVDKDSPVGNG